MSLLYGGNKFAHILLFVLLFHCQSQKLNCAYSGSWKPLNRLRIFAHISFTLSFIYLSRSFVCLFIHSNELHTVSAKVNYGVANEFKIEQRTCNSVHNGTLYMCTIIKSAYRYANCLLMIQFTHEPGSTLRFLFHTHNITHSHWTLDFHHRYADVPIML